MSGPTGCEFVRTQGEEGNLLALHPTLKPVNLLADAILDCSARDEVVLDAFLGSGTTLMSAERAGRRCFGEGGLVKRAWFQHYQPAERPERFDKTASSSCPQWLNGSTSICTR